MNDTDLEANANQEPLREMPYNYIPIEWFNKWYEVEDEPEDKG